MKRVNILQIIVSLSLIVPSMSGAFPTFNIEDIDKKIDDEVQRRNPWEIKAEPLNNVKHHASRAMVDTDNRGNFMVMWSENKKSIVARYYSKHHIFSPLNTHYTLPISVGYGDNPTLIMGKNAYDHTFFAWEHDASSQLNNSKIKTLYRAYDTQQLTLNNTYIFNGFDNTKDTTQPQFATMHSHGVDIVTSNGVALCNSLSSGSGQCYRSVPNDTVSRLALYVGENSQPQEHFYFRNLGENIRLTSSQEWGLPLHKVKLFSLKNRGLFTLSAGHHSAGEFTPVVGKFSVALSKNYVKDGNYKMDMASNGNIIYAWLESNKKNKNHASLLMIYYNFQTESWSPVYKYLPMLNQLEDNTLFDVSINGNGDAYVVWSDRDGLKRIIYDISTESWLAVKSIDKVGDYSDVTVEFSDNGHGIVTWAKDGYIYMDKYDPTRRSWSKNLIRTGEYSDVAVDDRGDCLLLSEDAGKIYDYICH